MLVEDTASVPADDMEEQDYARRSTSPRTMTTRTLRAIGASRLDVKNVLKNVAIFMLMLSTVFKLMQQTNDTKVTNNSAKARARAHDDYHDLNAHAEIGLRISPRIDNSSSIYRLLHNPTYERRHVPTSQRRALPVVGHARAGPRGRSADANDGNARNVCISQKNVNGDPSCRLMHPRRGARMAAELGATREYYDTRARTTPSSGRAH